MNGWVATALTQTELQPVTHFRKCGFLSGTLHHTVTTYVLSYFSKLPTETLYFKCPALLL